MQREIIEILKFNFLLLMLLLSLNLSAKCPDPPSISKYAKAIKSYKEYPDLYRNRDKLNGSLVVEIHQLE